MALPRVDPIICKEEEQAFDDPDWLFEVKYDGFRGILRKDRREEPRFISRSGYLLSRFDTLSKRVAAELKADEVIMDGELIAPDETGRPVFRNILKAGYPYRYIAFDLLWLNGEDLRSLPLVERRARLHALLPKPSDAIRECVGIEATGGKLFELVCTHDLEGIVAKRLADPYARGVNWYKIKNPGYSQKINRVRFSRKKPTR